jgi:hypothetical protein
MKFDDPMRIGVSGFWSPMDSTGVPKSDPPALTKEGSDHREPRDPSASAGSPLLSAGIGAQIPNPNRKLWLLESTLSHCKQTTETFSNREFLEASLNSDLRVSHLEFRAPAAATLISTRHWCRVEMPATRTKQTTAVPATRHWNRGSFAPSISSFQFRLSNSSGGIL